MSTDVLDPDTCEILATFALEGEEIGDAHYARATQMALGRLVKRLLQRDPEFLEALVAEADAMPFDAEAPIEAQLADAAYSTILHSAHRPNGPLPGELGWLAYEDPTSEELEAVGLTWGDYVQATQGRTLAPNAAE